MATTKTKADKLEALCGRLVNHIAGHFTRSLKVEEALGKRGMALLQQIADECQRRIDEREANDG